VKEGDFRRIEKLEGMWTPRPPAPHAGKTTRDGGSLGPGER